MSNEGEVLVWAYHSDDPTDGRKPFIRTERDPRDKFREYPWIETPLRRIIHLADELERLKSAVDTSLDVPTPFSGSDAEDALAECVENNFMTILAALRAPISSPVSREEVVEECAVHLAQTYPDHALINAYCAAIRSLSLSPAVQTTPVVSIKPMQLSGGRTDYFVSIKVGDRDVTPHVFSEEYKAVYHVALYDWLFNGSGEEPDVMAFEPDDYPARIMPSVQTTEPVAWREALENCLGCITAAESEGLHEVISELRGFSEQTDRLIDLVERRLLWVREYAAPILAAPAAAAPESGGS